jgi:hypothetical protein
METDLLVNPSMVSGGMANIETIDLPTLNFEEFGGGSSASSAPAAPNLVPSFENVGPEVVGGMRNFNAEPYSPQVKRVSDDAMMKEKYEILRKFERLSKMGVPMRKRFTMESSIEEMKMELEFIKREKSMDATIKQFSEWFVTGMSGLEYGSKNIQMMKAFGLQLDGLSEAAQMNVADLEDDFEELYDLYGENLKMHPMVRIPLRTCMMIYMVHLTNQMARKAPIPNIDDIMRQNPDIARSLAAAAMQNQTQQMRAQPSQPQQQQANPLAGLMSFMQQSQPPPPPPNMVPRPPQETKPVRIGVRKTPQVAPPPQPVVNAAPEMRAPPSIEELLKDIKQNAPSAPKKVNNKAGSTGKNSVVIRL